MSPPPSSEPSLCFSYLVAKFLLRGRGHFNGWFVIIIQKSEHRIIILLREGIELVVVTLAAIDAQSEPGLPDRVHAVDQRFDAKLLRLDAAFLVEHRIAQETGGDPLLQRRIRQQIAG